MKVDGQNGEMYFSSDLVPRTYTKFDLDTNLWSFRTKVDGLLRTYLIILQVENYILE